MNDKSVHKFFMQEGVLYDVFDLPNYFTVKGDIDISNMKLEELPDLSTVTVLGFFDCSKNNLKSLKGCPSRVKDFFCGFNDLTSLEYGPVSARVYSCFCNNLETLKGAPEKVEKFVCSFNDLETLKYGPKEAVIYDCSNNKLINLSGKPKYSGTEFFCKGNNFFENNIKYKIRKLREFLGLGLNYQR